MSLHRFTVPPPLALAVLPAPPKEAEKDKKADKDKKPAEPLKAQEKDAAKDDKARPAENVASPVPASPNSMIPEPPTPGPGAAPPTPTPADSKSPRKKNPSLPKEQEKPAEAVGPLKLLSPAPHNYLRAKLDLNPAKPYPPIPADPRGAYHQYAHAVGNEIVYVDITKDSWLGEQWKERSEREALARLTGETERQRLHEIEIDKKRRVKRAVPRGSGEIVMQLWNDVAEAPRRELAVDDFWAKYEWQDPAAKLHLLQIKRPASGETPPLADPTVEWTKEGLEETLAVVGIHCAYNYDRKTPRHWTEPSSGYLVLGHGFFMIRHEMDLRWKPEESAGKFELLVTSAHDRVFGNMIQEQQKEERKKKEEAYKAKKAAQKKKEETDRAKHDVNEGEGDGKRENEKTQEEGKKNAEEENRDPKEEEVKKTTPESKRVDAGAADAPGTPISNAAVHDGQVVHPPHPVPEPPAHIIAVPVLSGEKLKDKGEDVKHEVQDMAGKPLEARIPHREGEAGNPDGKGEKKDGDKAKKPFDPEHEAEMLAKMIGGDGPLNIDDIKLAFKALEKVSDDSKAKDKKDAGPMIWTWSDPCEIWRWKNYEAGSHLVGPGGWEERDWKVFADDRGCDEFDAEAADAEAVEEDVHDWSC
ncbi:hypothetical protein P7C73_g3459, partial [Tremellales sp. Uapishka_1]